MLLLSREMSFKMLLGFLPDLGLAGCVGLKWSISEVKLNLSPCCSALTFRPVSFKCLTLNVLFNIGRILILLSNSWDCRQGVLASSSNNVTLVNLALPVSTLTWSLSIVSSRPINSVSCFWTYHFATGDTATTAMARIATITIMTINKIRTDFFILNGY